MNKIKLFLSDNCWGVTGVAFLHKNKMAPTGLFWNTLAEDSYERVEKDNHQLVRFLQTFANYLDDYPDPPLLWLSTLVL